MIKLNSQVVNININMKMYSTSIIYVHYENALFYSLIRYLEFLRCIFNQ